MRRIIHNLRQQPEEVRTHILHVLTISSAVVLLFLWVFSLGGTITNEETQANVVEDLKPFSVLKSNIVDGYKSISEPTFPELE